MKIQRLFGLPIVVVMLRFWLSFRRSNPQFLKQSQLP